ncbi:MAG TPA: response regulator [Verrucomicrobiae bacterium]|nr:response regulator [Verrucomicrobiae bacterium]
MTPMTRILIVDDKEENIYYLRALLTGHGCAVESARHGAEALVKARQSPPDVIISDLLMPVMDGFTLLRLWKADDRLKVIPFIVYTATYTEPEDEHLALSLGADAFILKPAEPEVFLARLHEVQANAAASRPNPPRFATGDEKELLKVYSETLIRKLEEKTLQLEETNRALQRDIVERKKAEETLRLLNSAVLQAKESILISDAQLELPGPKIIFVNPAFTQMTGYTREEAVGQTPRILQGPRTDKTVLRRLRQNLEHGEVFDGEAIQYRKDGTEYFQEWRVTPLHDDNGKITHYVAIQRDITERKRSEEELRWKTAFLEAQVDSSLDGILVVDNHGKKLLQNKRMNELWKIPPHIIENKSDAVQLEFVTSRTKNPLQFAAKIAHLNSHPDEVSQDEIELVDGTILERYSSPVRGKAGTYYGRIWTFRDMTAQRKLEMQFRQSQKMEAFGQLAGGVAHDFNNILAVIQLQAAMLKSEPNLTLQQLEFAGDIEKAADRAANLTRQLLVFSRKQTMQLRNLKLKDVVDNMAKMLQRTLGEQINLNFKFTEEPLAIHADPGMIDQILLNLVVNARDAMPKGGQIVIETSAAEFDGVAATRTSQARPGLFVCLSVSDTGCGISPEILPRIFEPFFTTKEVGKGTGLGLATVFGIVQQHQGWINVESEVGCGTTFRVYLPRQTKATDTEFFWSSSDSPQGGGETILLVEDELAVRSSVRINLKRLGYHVLEADDGEEALIVWQQHRAEIRLLLTDLVMPGKINGKELAAQFLQQNPKLKVIYASGYSAEVAGNDLQLDVGLNFLAKPFTIQKLARAIRNQLDQN